MGNGEPNPARGVDGYAWVKRAIAQKGSDPQMEFGAAMITSPDPGATINVTSNNRWREPRPILSRAKPGVQFQEADNRITTERR